MSDSKVKIFAGNDMPNQRQEGNHVVMFDELCSHLNQQFVALASADKTVTDILEKYIQVLDRNTKMIGCLMWQLERKGLLCEADVKEFESTVNQPNPEAQAN